MKGTVLLVPNDNTSGHLAQCYISAISKSLALQRKVKEIVWLEDCQRVAGEGLLH